MRKIYTIFIIFFAGIIVLSGCKKKQPPPIPDDTVLGREYGTRPDWVDPSEIYGAGVSGFKVRDPKGLLSTGERVKNVLPSIYFDFDQSLIRPSERPKINEAVQYLIDHPGNFLLIEGHCDWRGTTEYNIGLGDRRAHSVKKYLETLAVDPNRISTLSKGDLEAMVEGSEEQTAQDRRADLIIIR